MGAALKELIVDGPIAGIKPNWAWGGSTGRGVRVAVVDSGVEWDHPALEKCVQGGVAVEYDQNADPDISILDDPQPIDLSGHGTACAGIIHKIAPEAELFSVRVLGRDMKGRGIQFATGLDWAIENSMRVVNLSLSTSRSEYFALLHSLADTAYFKNILLVSAVNNIPSPSYPSLYASVISVAANDGTDPFVYYYNPDPPVEFGAPGMNVRVAWKGRQYLTSTGNSFAAPHMTGIAALIIAKHPELTPFQVKTVLYACAANVRKIEGG